MHQPNLPNYYHKRIRQGRHTRSPSTRRTSGYQNDLTGGCFSTCYHVRNIDESNSHYGQLGFLKVIDYAPVSQSDDIPTELQRITTEFNFERELVELCKNKRMRHIVKGIESDEEDVPGYKPISRLNYLIFESAKYDIRQAISVATSLDAAWKFTTLHNVANGMRQLHSVNVSHQDIKPSNILDFGDLRKIGDLGRAHRSGVRGPHDHNPIAGDHSYAAIELLYGYVHDDERARRLANDFYQLGGLMFFLFTGINLTSAILSNVERSHHPQDYSGGYRQILPELRLAFDLVTQEIGKMLPSAFHDRAITTFKELSDPDILERGISQSLKGTPSRFRMDVYVSRFDLLAKIAKIAVKNALQ